MDDLLTGMLIAGFVAWVIMMCLAAKAIMAVASVFI